MQFFSPPLFPQRWHEAVRETWVLTFDTHVFKRSAALHKCFVTVRQEVSNLALPALRSSLLEDEMQSLAYALGI